MRRLWIATVMLMLVAGSGLGVAGLDDGDPVATYVTGRTVEALGMLEPCEGKGCDQSVARILEWSDTRLPSRMWERIEGYILEGSVPPFPDPYEAEAVRWATR